MKNLKNFLKSEGFFLLAFFLIASIILFIFNKKIESYTGEKIFIFPLIIFVILSVLFAGITINRLMKTVEGRDKVINFFKSLVFIPGCVIIVILIIYGSGKLFSSFDPWSKEKKEAYAFYLLKREIISNPELLSKITVSVQKNKDSFYEEIKPKDIKVMSSYPQPYGIIIQIPYAKWNKFAQQEIDNYFTDLALNRLSLDGKGCSSQYFLSNYYDREMGISAHPIGVFKRYHQGKIYGWTQTPYNMNHEKLGEREKSESMIVLKKSLEIIKTL